MWALFLLRHTPELQKESKKKGAPSCTSGDGHHSFSPFAIVSSFLTLSSASVDRAQLVCALPQNGCRNCTVVQCNFPHPIPTPPSPGSFLFFYDLNDFLLQTKAPGIDGEKAGKLEYLSVTFISKMIIAGRTFAARSKGGLGGWNRFAKWLLCILCFRFLPLTSSFSSVLQR